VTSPDLNEHRVLIDACLKLRVPFLWLGPGTLLISPIGIQRVIAEVRSCGADILGLEGFELDTFEVHPRLDLIFDSSVVGRPDPATLVAGWGVDVWVEVSLRH
jgi:hypothetical protein